MPNSLDIPNNFTAGTDAVAAQVNANFDAVIDYLEDNMVAKDGTVEIVGTQTVNNLTVTGTLTTSGDISATVDTLKGEVLADDDVIVLQNGATVGSGWFKGDIQDSSGTTIVDVSTATFNGDITGNAATVTEATSVAVSASSGTTGQIAIIDATTSPQGIKYDTALDWNSISNIFNVVGEVQCTTLDVNGSADISGALTGVDSVTCSGTVSGSTLSGTNLTLTGNGQADYFKATTGSAGAPSFRIEDNDTGLFSTGGGTFAASCNSIEVWATTTTAFKPSGSNGSKSLGVNGLAWSAVYASNGTIQASDERKKTMLDDALGLDFLMDLTPFSGVWTNDVDGVYEQHEWLSAQNVRAALITAGRPSDVGMWHVETEDPVTGDPIVDGMQSLNYAEFVPVLVKAVQELTSRLETLEAA